MLRKNYREALTVTGWVDDDGRLSAYGDNMGVDNMGVEKEKCVRFYSVSVRCIIPTHYMHASPSRLLALLFVNR